MQNREILATGLSKYNIELDSEKYSNFSNYARLLEEWNKVMNLTGITDEKEVFIKHFLDSCSILDGFTMCENASIIDIGTGAGFPGLPLKIARPDFSATLVDSLTKRINFLDEVCDVCGIDDVTNIHARAEDLAKDELFRESYDYAVSRAVASMNVLLEYMLPFVKVGGYVLALKGPKVLDEVKTLDKALDILGGELIEVKKVSVFNDDREHFLCIVKKIADTPNKYPRKAGKPTKSPL